MQTLKHYSIILLLLIFFSCNVKPQNIEYGSDACQFCQMTIVNKLHAAEIVTKKGKVYTFDATECMVNFLKDFGSSKVQFYLSTDYATPDTFTDATQATFLVSKNIPSPMGAFLSAFKMKTDALKMKNEKEGDLYSWDELLVHFKDKNK